MHKSRARRTKKSLRWSPGVIIMLAFFSTEALKFHFSSPSTASARKSQKKNKHHSRVPRNIFRLLDVRLLSQSRNLFLNIFSSFPFILFELKNSRIFVFFFVPSRFILYSKRWTFFSSLLSTVVAR